MSTSFASFFAPNSVVLIGASDRPNSVGNVILRNLRAGFGGRIDLVNPNHARVGGAISYHDVASLPQTPELAVVAIPPDQVASAVAQLAAKGTKAAVIITGGFGELGERGAEMQRAVLAAAGGRVRIVGPNCVGVMAPASGLNASFAHLEPAPGRIAFFSQSGALITAVLDWAMPRGIGFSTVVSLGDMADVDVADMLDYAASDPGTDAIVLYLEGIANGRRFLSAAREAALRKPVVVLKAGRQGAALKAAHSHTGALAGSDKVYDAAFRRAGLLRVETMPEMFDAVETLQFAGPQHGQRLTILSNGGGLGVLATDALVARGGTLTELAPETIATLNGVLPATWSHGNPIDIIGDAGPPRYARALDAVLADPNTDAVLVLNCPVALADSSAAARAVIECVRGRTAAPNVFTAFIGESEGARARSVLEAASLPTYETPDDGVTGFMHCVRYAHNQQLAKSAPVPAPRIAAFEEIEAMLRDAAARNVRWLDGPQVDRLLRAYDIPAVDTRYVADEPSAARAAEALNGPVVLKLRSPDVTHKSDLGAVALNLSGATAVLAAATAMRARILAALPQARIEGFLVQPMIVRPGAVELIAGINRDATFGPVVVAGHGGTAVEVIGDSSIELAPLDLPVARAQIARTRIARILAGYRGQPAADVDAVAGVLVRLGDLALAHPAVAEIDINPLLADPGGVLAVDARIGLAQGTFSEERLPEPFTPARQNGLIPTAPR